MLDNMTWNIIEGTYFEYDDMENVLMNIHGEEITDINKVVLSDGARRELEDVLVDTGRDPYAGAVIVYYFHTPVIVEVEKDIKRVSGMYTDERIRVATFKKV